jgi:hypothetical protein
MKKVLALAAAAIFVVAAAGSLFASSGTVEGTIRKVNLPDKWMVVADTSGRETTIFWSDATKVEGGDPKAGEKVTVKAIEKDGKTCATWVHVGAWNGGVR